MFTTRFHRVSATFLLSLAMVAGSTLPASAQGKKHHPHAPSYQQQLQQQLQKDQQFLQQQEQWFKQMQQQQLSQQQMMQNWYQQQMQQQQMMQQWLMQRNARVAPQSTPTTQVRRTR